MLRSTPPAVVAAAVGIVLVGLAAMNEAGGFVLGDWLGRGVMGSRCSFVSGRRRWDDQVRGSHFCQSCLKGLGMYFGFLCFRRVWRRTKKMRRRPRMPATIPMTICMFC